MNRNYILIFSVFALSVFTVMGWAGPVHAQSAGNGENVCGLYRVPVTDLRGHILCRRMTTEERDKKRDSLKRNQLRTRANRNQDPLPEQRQQIRQQRLEQEAGVRAIRQRQQQVNTTQQLRRRQLRRSQAQTAAPTRRSVRQTEAASRGQQGRERQQRRQPANARDIQLKQQRQTTLERAPELQNDQNLLREQTRQGQQ